ncbi:hypothetical protein [Saccharopolyspora spinosa]|uniref:Uncharacterized protein n=1 Tax=Saccharopolyspora spinosa TaxID=60894 RepID=A0A2N3XSB1_SACSN|nr:hypothetical protein [Saccharopolyspora spinosa]PKW13555.1 hypothetical protein A8926_1092 [Saccharopolyspora spinosa]
MLEDLDACGLTNHVLVITRYPVLPEDCDRLNKLRNVKLTMLFTYSGIDDRRVEPINSDIAANSLRWMLGARRPGVAPSRHPPVPQGRGRAPSASDPKASDFNHLNPKNRRSDALRHRSSVPTTPAISMGIGVPIPIEPFSSWPTRSRERWMPHGPGAAQAA